LQIVATQLGNNSVVDVASLPTRWGALEHASLAALPASVMPVPSGASRDGMDVNLLNANFEQVDFGVLSADAIALY
jgi:hypothetical protein